MSAAARTGIRSIVAKAHLVFRVQSESNGQGYHPSTVICRYPVTILQGDDLPVGCLVSTTPQHQRRPCPQSRRPALWGYNPIEYPGRGLGQVGSDGRKPKESMDVVGFLNLYLTTLELLAESG